MIKAGATIVAVLGLVISMSIPAHGLDRDSRWRTGGDPRACSAPVWPQSNKVSGPGAGNRVLVLGDSLTRESAEMLKSSLRRSGWVPTIRCFGGKRLDWAIDQVRAQERWKSVPSTVIVAMGTNDMRWIERGRTSDRVDQLLEQLGPHRNVLWINTFGGNGDRFSKEKQRWFNQMLDRKASKRSNVVVMPWDEIAARGKVKLSSAIHYTYPGYRLRTQEMVGLLNSSFGKIEKPVQGPAAEQPTGVPETTPNPTLYP